MRTEATSTLLRRVREGDEDARERLFLRLVGSVRRWARGRLPRWARQGVDTEDIVQNALADVARRLGDFEPRHRDALRHYLRSAVRNQIRDQIRRARRRPANESLDGIDVAGVDRSDGNAEEQEVLDRVARGLCRLSRADRELVVARLQTGLSYDQIALITGRPSADAARVAIRRAVVRLAEILERE